MQPERKLLVAQTAREEASDTKGDHAAGPARELPLDDPELQKLLAKTARDYRKNQGKDKEEGESEEQHEEEKSNQGPDSDKE